MKHLFVPYHLAVLAKEKGLNELCFGRYNKDGVLLLEIDDSSFSRSDISAPLYQQLVDWFREKHGITVTTGQTCRSGTAITCYYPLLDKITSLIDDDTEYDTYYEALTKALEEAFKLI